MGENYFTSREENGTINISEEVITGLVKSAVFEVEGVAGISNTAGAEIAELIGLKTVTKGIKVQFADGNIVVDVIITVIYGCSIMTVAQNVQENILNVLTSTTGADKAEVNVHVCGVAFDK